MMVMAAGQMVARIIIAGLRRLMIVGVVQFDREIAEPDMPMFGRRARRVLECVDRARQRGTDKDEHKGDA